MTTPKTNVNATDNDGCVAGYGTAGAIAQRCLEETNGDLAGAARLAQRYVTGRAAQQKVIGAITKAVTLSKAGKQ